MLHDRRQVDVADVVVPVDGAGIEPERVALVRVDLVPQREQVVDAVDRFALGVRAVQLDVRERALGFVPALFEARR